MKSLPLIMGICALFIFAETKLSAFKQDFQNLGSLELVNSRTEFRKKCVGIDQSKCFWFISFANIDEKLQEIMEQKELTSKLEISGKFEHGNFSGHSFVVLPSFRISYLLESIDQENPLLSIWDYIECNYAKIDFITLDSKNIILFLSDLQECESIDND